MENRIPGISRLIVRRNNEEQKTQGGIFLSTSEETAMQMTTILAVGEVKGTYGVGNTAYIPRHAGIEIDGGDDIVVLEGDILYQTPKD